MASIMRALLAALLLLPMTTAMHSDCMFRKEEAMCLEKIQKANDLMGFNDSSPGEQGGGADKVSLAYNTSLQPPHGGGS